MYNPYDFYFKQAKKKWYKARSVFKLEEIDKKYKIFTSKEKYILDIGCAPGSWIQYIYNKLSGFWKDFKIVWFDIKSVDLNFPGVYTYQQDITNLSKVENILKDLQIQKFDVITSDMAPNTIWIKDVDSIRLVNLIEKSLPIYEKFLKKKWKVVIKLFMGSKFDYILKLLKNILWWKNIKIIKPQATRKNSKEVYFVKY